jgi:uncharacterized protein YdbL (DUF1318 family)
MKKQLIIGFLSLMVCGAPAAFAQYEIKELTPAVKKSLDQRRERFEEIKDLKTAGIIGENNQGYLDVLIVHQRAAELVRAENHDRLIIYKTIIEQNNLRGELATVETVFAKVQAEKAGPGEMIQNEDGLWEKKK